METLLKDEMITNVSANFKLLILFYMGTVFTFLFFVMLLGIIMMRYHPDFLIKILCVLLYLATLVHLIFMYIMRTGHAATVCSGDYIV